MFRISHFTTLLTFLVLFSACGTEKTQNPKKSDTGQKSISESSSRAVTTRALIRASLEGNMETVKRAVKQGMEVDSRDKAGRTPLMMAAYNGHSEIVRFLLKKGADPNKADKQGRTPLIFASSGSYPQTVKLLLEKGENPNVTDSKEGWTALMWAAAEGNDKVVRVLLDNGADPSLTDKDNETARDFAAGNGHEKLVELLKQYETGN